MSERELFWKWAKDENPKLVEEAETGCQFAKDILDYMFMGWVGSANRQGYKIVPVEPTQNMIDNAVDKTSETPSQDYWHSSQPICDDQAVECYKAMIGAVE